ncbi:LysR family transcriptional regulator [Shewanella schlegeliana]|uniref:LysR family transcriptional regulator n=1 Tax=Shewanella schlegeliana TaxID=190308 RepID=A0ABS1T0V6_9GAMM|nr:LysR family transcriptional regulator [Shewanella schlegeliana]MBL4914215.1 LysR family transcriptional regulator [Shewanella schlegeliana]MCL1111391.1 LysR family transcriptional regulator [Shewanella schlegeliana]GIU33921.1 transcriptional regulator [Shewanella schlegeliana]
MLTIEQLYSFVTTVETGSFSAAARKLGKVQSAVSQHIINLEIDTNQTLFDRSHRYPVLTRAGEQLLPQAQAVLAQHQRLNLQVQALDKQDELKLTLAVDEAIPYDRLTTMLKSFSAQYPECELELLCASSLDIIHLVDTKRANLGIVFSELSYPQSLDFESLGTVQFELLVSPNHPLSHETSSHIDVLKLHRQLLIGSKENHKGWFNTPHSPNVWHADNYYMLFELAKAGFGWALLPLHLCEEAIAARQLCKLKIDFEQLGWQANVDVIQHKSRSENEFNKKIRTLMRGLLN